MTLVGSGIDQAILLRIEGELYCHFGAGNGHIAPDISYCISPEGGVSRGVSMSN